MWKANIDKVAAEEKDVVVVVTFFEDSGKGKFQQDFHFSSGSKEVVLGAIQTRLNSLNTIQSLPADVPLGPFAVSTPTAPTPEEQARLDYIAGLRLFRQMVSAVTVGAKTTLDQDYIEAKDFLKAQYLSAYLDLF